MRSDDACSYRPKASERRDCPGPHLAVFEHLFSGGRSLPIMLAIVASAAVLSTLLLAIAAQPIALDSIDVVRVFTSGPIRLDPRIVTERALAVAIASLRRQGIKVLNPMLVARERSQFEGDVEPGAPLVIRMGLASHARWILEIGSLECAVKQESATVPTAVSAAWKALKKKVGKCEVASTRRRTAHDSVATVVANISGVVKLIDRRNGSVSVRREAEGSHSAGIHMQPVGRSTAWTKQALLDALHDFLAEPLSEVAKAIRDDQDDWPLGWTASVVAADGKNVTLNKRPGYGVVPSDTLSVDAAQAELGDAMAGTPMRGGQSGLATLTIPAVDKESSVGIANEGTKLRREKRSILRGPAERSAQRTTASSKVAASNPAERADVGGFDVGQVQVERGPAAAPTTGGSRPTSARAVFRPASHEVRNALESAMHIYQTHLRPACVVVPRDESGLTVLTSAGVRGFVPLNQAIRPRYYSDVTAGPTGTFAYFGGRTTSMFGLYWSVSGGAITARAKYGDEIACGGDQGEIIGGSVLAVNAKDHLLAKFFCTVRNRTQQSFLALITRDRIVPLLVRQEGRQALDPVAAYLSDDDGALVLREKGSTWEISYVEPAGAVRNLAAVGAPGPLQFSTMRWWKAQLLDSRPEGLALVKGEFGGEKTPVPRGAWILYKNGQPIRGLGLEEFTDKWATLRQRAFPGGSFQKTSALVDSAGNVAFMDPYWIGYWSQSGKLTLWPLDAELALLEGRSLEPDPTRTRVAGFAPGSRLIVQIPTRAGSVKDPIQRTSSFFSLTGEGVVHIGSVGLPVNVEGKDGCVLSRDLTFLVPSASGGVIVMASIACGGEKSEARAYDLMLE